MRHSGILVGSALLLTLAGSSCGEQSKDEKKKPAASADVHSAGNAVGVETQTTGDATTEEQPAPAPAAVPAPSTPQKTKGDPVAGEVAISTPVVSETRDRSIDDNGAGFMLKSAKQLDNTIQACLGARQNIRNELILQTGSLSGVAFLNPDIYAVGDNIIKLSQEMLDGNEVELRAGVRAANVSVPYLTALQNIANVVAYNCQESKNDVGSNSDLCECGTVAQAKRMLGACLPSYEPSEYEAIATSFAAKCAVDQRGAISSFIASLAFAKAP